MVVADSLKQVLDRRVLVLDGSWGVLIQRHVRGEEAYRGRRFRDHGRDVAGDPDLLNLTQPEIVSSIHRAYFEAGADISTTNTFTATSIGQADYGLEGAVYELNVAGAQLAKQAAAGFENRFVAGSVGPLNVTLSLSPKVDDPAYRSKSFDDVRESYAEQIRGLRDGGVDLLLIETIFDTLNAKAAIAAAREVAPQVPLWISVTIVDLSGRTLSGQTIEGFWTAIEHADPLIVGSTARSARRRCGRTSPTSRGSPRVSPRRIRTPACRTPSGVTTRRPTSPPRCCTSSRATAC
jgi:5-methyltetrahydrofolate--homocysteine methyltransferase